MRTAPLLLIAVGLIGLLGRWSGTRHSTVSSCSPRRSSWSAPKPTASAQHDQPRASVSDRRRGRGQLDDRAGAAQGALRAERDHHDADDDVHRHQPRRDPHQADRSRISPPTSRRRAVLDFAAMLPAIPGTRIHVGVLIAGAAAIVVWFLMSRTGARPPGRCPRRERPRRAHMGSRRGSSSSCSSSPGSFVGLAAASEILGIWGTCAPTGIPRSACGSYPWVFPSPACIRSPIPYVFPSRWRRSAATSRPRGWGTPPRFTLLLVGLTSSAWRFTEWTARRREYEGSYLPGVAARRRRAGKG